METLMRALPGTHAAHAEFFRIEAFAVLAAAPSFF
jgi:hypothetical protein